MVFLLWLSDRWGGLLLEVMLCGKDIALRTRLELWEQGWCWWEGQHVLWGGSPEDQGTAKSHLLFQAPSADEHCLGRLWNASGLHRGFPFFCFLQFSSVAQSCLTLQPHGLQHARPPCPSPTPGVYSNSCLLSWWCHPAISSSVIPFSHLQSFPESGSFPMSQFTSCGQSTVVSASVSVLPMNI